jgi:hypothetical protein
MQRSAITFALLASVSVSLAIGMLLSGASAKIAEPFTGFGHYLLIFAKFGIVFAMVFLLPILGAVVIASWLLERQRFRLVASSAIILTIPIFTFSFMTAILVARPSNVEFLGGKPLWLTSASGLLYQCFGVFIVSLFVTALLLRVVLQRWKRLINVGGECQCCGYPLLGVEFRQCPECGAEYTGLEERRSSGRGGAAI